MFNFSGYEKRERYEDEDDYDYEEYTNLHNCLDEDKDYANEIK